MQRTNRGRGVAESGAGHRRRVVCWLALLLTIVIVAAWVSHFVSSWSDPERPPSTTPLELGHTRLKEHAPGVESSSTEPGGSIASVAGRVRVVDAADGTPIDRAQVLVSRRRTTGSSIGDEVGSTTDANGECQVRVPGPGFFNVTVSRDGFASASVPGVAFPGIAVISLHAANRFGLRVVRSPGSDPDHGRATGITLVIRSTSGTYRRAIPAQPGRIEWIEDAPAGLIRISSPEIILSTQEFENRGCNRLIDVFVAGVAALEGRVVDQRTDRPVSDAMISLLSNLACVPQGEARSDDGGAFRLPRPAAGGDLIVSAEGYATKRVGLRIGIDDQLKSTDVTVRLDPTRPLRFQIVDDSGEPVAGARLEFLDLNNGRAADARHVACVSTAQGLAVCEAFSAGQRVAAYVRHESFGNRWYIVRPEDWKTGGPVIVRLRTDVTLLGHVRTPSGAPVCGAVILIVQPVRQTGATLAERSTGTVTDASGQFKLPLPSAGPVEVHADAPGFARRRVIVPSAAIESGELDIVLTPSAILHGRVLDETGAPIARVIVNAESKLSHSDGEPLFIAQRLTDETGSFAFEGVPEGMIFKQVHVMDRRFRCESAYGVRPGDSPIEITAIAKRGAVTLCLIGQPVDELHAVLHILDRTSGRRSSRLVAIREGKASVGSLPDGELTVQIALRSHFSDRLLLHPSNDRIRRECRIVPGVRVRGRVRLDAEPSQTACLILVDRERVTPELVGSISATGDFQIESVPPGTYECHALNSGVKTRFGEITILRNRSEQQLELSR